MWTLLILFVLNGDVIASITAPGWPSETECVEAAEQVIEETDSQEDDIDMSYKCEQDRSDEL